MEPSGAVSEQKLEDYLFGEKMPHPKHEEAMALFPAILNVCTQFTILNVCN